jgi:hypothetical protein
MSPLPSAAVTIQMADVDNPPKTTHSKPVLARCARIPPALLDCHVHCPVVSAMCRNKSAGLRIANGRRLWSTLCATVGAFSVGGARMAQSNSRANFASTGAPVRVRVCGARHCCT